MDDKRIIELLFERSELGIKYLDEKYGRLISNISQQILSDLEDSAECRNDTYLAIWNSIPPQKPEFLRAYICKITRNIALKIVRSRTTLKRGGFTQVALEELGDCIPGGNAPCEMLESKEIGKYLNDFLEVQSEKERNMFIQRYFFGDSIESIATRYKLRPNTVSTKLLRLRKSLKTYLEQHEVYL